MIVRISPKVDQWSHMWSRPGVNACGRRPDKSKFRVYSQLGTKHDWRIYTVTIQECLNEVTENGGFITVMITVQIFGQVTMRTCHKRPEKDLGLYQVWDVRVRPSVNTQGLI